MGRLKESLATMLYRSRKSDFVSDVDLDFLLDLWNKQEGLCYYTGRPMVATDKVGRGRDMDALSIDKINPLMGYVRNNIVLCSWWANSAKSTLSVMELLGRCETLVTHLSSRIAQRIQELP